MNAYHTWMDRQTVSELTHHKLLQLDKGAASAPRPKNWTRRMALAAALAVAMGVGAFALTHPGRPGPREAALTPSALPDRPVTESAGPGMTGMGDRAAFLAQGPGEEAERMFPNIWGLDYTADPPATDASIILPDGAFSVPLLKEDILPIFWGAGGKPPVTDPRTDTGDFPLLLTGWAGYLIYGDATYDGNGDLWEVRLWGERGDDSFTLCLAPGRIPPTCAFTPPVAVTTVVDTEVSAWCSSHDRDGDGQVEHIVTCQFLAGGVGARFENVGSPYRVETGGEDPGLAGAKQFNAMLANHACRTDSPLYLGHLLRNENIPPWREVSFSTLDEARGEASFAPYLPTAAPPGFGSFYGHLSYQRNSRNGLWVHWSRGYDDVEVAVQRPEGISAWRAEASLVDIAVPESYDWRLYDGPIWDTVPQEYREEFYCPTFRAEDMSLEVVRARMTTRDTGGMGCTFSVLHPDGTVVRYTCAGVSPEYVWSLVEATL